MKKLVSVLMSIVFILCICSTGLVSFAGSTGEIARGIERKSITLAQAQNPVEIDVKIASIGEDMGFTSYNFTLEYDERLKVSSIDKHEADEAKDLFEDFGLSMIISNALFSEPIKGEALLYTIAFTLPADVAVGDKYEIKFEDDASTQLKLVDESILPDATTYGGYIEIVADDEFAVTASWESFGCTVAPEAGYQSPVEPGEDYKFTVDINDGYHKGVDFAVKSNSETLTPADGVYTINDIRENKTITVEGVVPHSFDDDYCADSESHWLECSCGETSEPEAHTFGAKISNNNGTHTCTCSVCQHSETDDCQYIDVVTPPTTDAPGYTTHTCEVCGYSFTDTQTQTHTHTYGEWQLDSNTLLSKTCSVCGAKISFTNYIWNGLARAFAAFWARAVVPIIFNY